MRLVFGLVLLVGLGLAGFAVYMAQGYISQYQVALAQEKSARANQIKLTEIYVANRAMAYGETFTLEDATLVKWPAEVVPEGAFASEDELFPEGAENARTVLRPIEANEPLLAIKVTDPGEDAGITSRLSKGMRAFAISVDVKSGVSGFLRPGDRVDVYWTGSVRERAKVTKLIEAGVRLIAVDQTADENRSSPAIARTVTVEASPRQVAALAQAQSTGQLSLSLVGAQDETISSAVEIDQNQLLGIEEEQKVVEAAKPEVCTIRTRRGSEVLEIPIPCTN
ncbi:MAG: Flp pilus assembly protein CpaB [Confluentimicrobium sp.]|jgi:pilus assembly protein CpaB|uniref:Flp pilus assembly protein CpaB n=1 Tax=Actibacterium sp. TaxID=1872125 RepID=UPI000C62FF72|nr:Flp pilus assembly protein CpaB [Actibacterium sp.]MBC56141.1 Flp pilus assembly protein CpaB [Actibacterium sp.]|tara:strand:+ start:2336 stop:3178 length:843 start_codon:yes stop_codon:yes gene_type:complete